MSVMSDSLQPHRLQPARLLCPWDSPGKNIGVGCHALLQGIFLTQEWNPCLVCLRHWRGGSVSLGPPGKLMIIYKVDQKNWKTPEGLLTIGLFLNAPLSFSKGVLVVEYEAATSPWVHGPPWTCVYRQHHFRDKRVLSDRVRIICNSGLSHLQEQREGRFPGLGYFQPHAVKCLLVWLAGVPAHRRHPRFYLSKDPFSSQTKKSDGRRILPEIL